MGISLEKGQRVSLNKVAPGLNSALIGLRWDVNPTDTGTDFDLDLSVFLLGENEKLISEKHLIFYNNFTSPDPHKSVRLMGDNRTGEGEGDDEVVAIDLSKIPQDIAKIAISVTIHEAEKRGQNFGQISNAHVRLVNIETKEEVLRYNLAEDFSLETAIVMAEFYRQDGWDFNALGSGYQGGLKALIKEYK